jgi:hypothetical protein
MMIGPREPDAAMPASFEELRRRAELLEAREASDPASATEPLTDDLRAFLEAEDRLGDFLGGLDPDSADPDAAPAPDVPADTPGELAPGEICGDCRIIRWVGAGGMGEVYEAEDLGLSMSDTPAAATGRRVALKVLPQWWLGRRAGWPSRRCGGRSRPSPGCVTRASRWCTGPAWTAPRNAPAARWRTW